MEFVYKIIRLIILLILALSVILLTFASYKYYFEFANNYLTGVSVALLALFAFLFYKVITGSYLKTNVGFQDEIYVVTESIYGMLDGLDNILDKQEAEKQKNEKEKQKKEKEKLNEKQRQYSFIRSLRKASGHEPIVSTYLGGSGYRIEKGNVILVTLCGQILCLSQINSEETIEIPLDELISIEITGPGKQTSNIGLFGGGFGFEGAAKGILVASIVNALTTKTKIDAYLQIGTPKGEVMLHVTTVEPNELRSLLSPAFVKVKSLQNTPHHDLATELEKLHQMFLDGVLTESEFQLAKDKLLLKN